MRNIILTALVAALLAGMAAGCKKKKPVVDDPTRIDPTALETIDTGDPADAGMVRPRVKVVDTGTGTGTVTTLPPTDTTVTDTTATRDTTTLPPAGGSTYTIRKKDTLWSIATRYLGSGKRWPEIVAVNPGLDPKKLRIGQTIKIPQR